MTSSREGNNIEPVQRNGSSWFMDPSELTNVIRTHIGRANGLDQIPGIEIHEQISTGGQARVFAGVDIETRECVAVKVLLDGLFTGAASRRRFQRELDIVSDMSHPCIVATLRHGTTDHGLSYLVMPRIDGIALDLWYEQTRACGNLRRIVEIMARVCDAVGFAHQHGVIHRDLKPSNILVDSDDNPHILDFGLAKLVREREAKLNTETDVTSEGQFVGSIHWTSPEQLAGVASRVDTRTDVYALGVMLYQSLTGAFPYPVEGNLPSIVNNVLNSDPVPIGELNESVSRDLEAIVLKALAKEPDARYSTVAELAKDLRCFLSGEPVIAMRERIRLRLQRHVRRYRAIAIVSVVLLTVIGFLYFQASRDRDRAKVETAKAQASAAFLQNLLAEVDPRRRGVDVTVAELLDNAAEEIPDQFADQAEVWATLEFMLGRAYGNIGLYDQSHDHLHRAWQMRCDLLGRNHLETLDVAMFLATSSSKPCTDEGAELLEYIAAERRNQLGPTHRDTLCSEFYLVLLDCRRHAGNGKIRSQLEGIYERAKATLGSGDRLFHRIQLARVQYEFHFGCLRRAESLCRSLLEFLEAVPDPNYEYRLGASYHLSWMLFEAERFDESLRLNDEALVGMQRALGAEHPATQKEKVLQVRLLVRSGRLMEAEQLLASMHGLEESALAMIGVCDIGYSEAVMELRQAQGRWDDAVAWMEAWIARRQDRFGIDRPELIRDECLLAHAQFLAAHFDDAIRNGEKLVDRSAFAEIPDYFHAQLLMDLIEGYVAVNHPDAARMLMPKASELIVDGFRPDHSLSRRLAASSIRLMGRPFQGDGELAPIAR